MAARLKVLRFTQKIYQDMGICPSPSNPNLHSINWRNCSVLISLAQMLIFSLAFLAFKADNIVDVGTAFYAVVTETVCSIYMIINFYNMPKILKLIEKFETFIDQSKSFGWKSSFFLLKFWISIYFLECLGIKKSDTSTKYSDLIEIIEKVTKWYYIVYVKVTSIGMIFATLLITLINYFVNDLGDESYFLAFPVLCVL